MGILFIPTIKIDKIPKLQFDENTMVVLDLEDPVPGDMKDSALNSLIEYLKSDAGIFNYMVRINLVKDSGLDEIRRIKKECSEGIVNGFIVPKSTCEDIVKAKECAGDIPLVPIIETIDGINEFDQICDASNPSLIFFGLNDISTDLQIIRPRYTGNSFIISQMISQLVIKCRYRNIQLAVGSYVFIHDLNGFRKECEFIKKLGVDIYISIHPKQLPIAEEVFSVPQEDFEWAQEVISCYDGRGCVARGQRMYGPPHYKLAKKIIEKSRLYSVKVLENTVEEKLL